MRVLSFNVEGQIMSLDSSCDPSTLVPGSEGYLEAQFTCSSEWIGLVKVVGFWSALGVEYEPQVLDERDKCVIPTEAAKHRSFKLELLGKGSNMKLKTNKIEIVQGGGIT